MVDSERFDDLLTIRQLSNDIPTFEWSKGSSGRMLTKEQALKLEEILHHYLMKCSEDMDGDIVNGFSSLFINKIS